MFRLIVFFIFLGCTRLGFIANADVTAVEICDNGIDDDGDGLTDCEDPDCYFSNPACECNQTTVIWGITNNKTLMWFNPSTGVEQTIGTYTQTMTDVAWSPNGTLYGIGINGDLYEIDPTTGNATTVSTSISVPGNVTALCSDQQGILYFATRLGTTPRFVYKFNTATNNQSAIANIGNYEAAGDLAFIDGVLYLSTVDEKLLVIDINTGTFTVKPLPPVTDLYFGLVNDANGVLYISAGKNIYTVDTATGNTTLIYTSTTSINEFYGLSILSDNCQSDACLPGVIITTDSPGPYCIGTPVTLQAEIPPGADPYSGTFNWITPSGAKTGSFILANASGQYIVSINTGECSAADTIDLVFENTPSVDLGPDITISNGQSVTLQPSSTGPSAGYTWSDGVNGPSRSVNTPGTYILCATNNCGTDCDTVVVTDQPLPCNQKVDITLSRPAPYCTETTVDLTAVIPAGADPYSGTFTWDTPGGALTGKTITADTSGRYIVSISTANCTASDTATLAFTTTAVVSLGNDTTICTGRKLNLSPLDGIKPGIIYQWEDNSTTIPRSVGSGGTYILSATNSCGTSIDTIIVTDTADCLCQVLAPTAFTPNGDNNNDKFLLLNTCSKPIILETFAVYNRWNEELFNTINPAEGWDGTYKGQVAPLDVYIYVAQGLVNGEPFSIKGILTLLR